MNALIHDEHEVPVANQEAIEVHIESLHTGLTEVKTDIRELRADNKTLRDKIDSMDERLNAKIDSMDQRVNAKIDSVNESLSQKLTKLSHDVADMRGLQKAMLWVIGGVGSLATVLITVGKALHWF